MVFFTCTSKEHANFPPEALFELPVTKVEVKENKKVTWCQLYRRGLDV